MVYMYDINVHSRAAEERLEVLGMIFKTLEYSQLTLESKKCKIFNESVEYLGHKNSSMGLQINDDRRSKVLNFKIPNSAS